MSARKRRRRGNQDGLGPDSPDRNDGSSEGGLDISAANELGYGDSFPANETEDLDPEDLDEMAYQSTLGLDSIESRADSLDSADSEITEEEAEESVERYGRVRHRSGSIARFDDETSEEAREAHARYRDRFRDEARFTDDEAERALSDLETVAFAGGGIDSGDNPAFDAVSAPFDRLFDEQASPPDVDVFGSIDAVDETLALEIPPELRGETSVEGHSASRSAERPLPMAAHEEPEALKPWELPELPRPLSDQAPSLIETIGEAGRQASRSSSGVRKSRSVPPPPPGQRSDDWRLDEASRDKSASFEIASQDVVYDLPLWQRRNVRRGAQVVLAGMVGLVLGWMAWDSTGGAELHKGKKANATAARDAGPADAGAPDPGAEEAREIAAAEPATREPVVTPLPVAPEVEPAPPAPVDIEPAPPLPEIEPAPATEETPVEEVAAVPVDEDCDVRIVSKPRGAEVFFRGKRIGKTPYRGEIRCGKRTVVVKRDKYKSTRIEQELVPGTVNRVEIALERPLYKVRVTSTPSRADVTINGEAVGQTPYNAELPAYARARIVVAKEGHRDWSRTMVPKEKKSKVAARLKRDKNSAADSSTSAPLPDDPDKVAPKSGKEKSRSDSKTKKSGKSARKKNKSKKGKGKAKNRNARAGKRER